MLKTWNHGLVIAAFLLAIFGTFVVRSGIIQSVHTLRHQRDRALVPRLPRLAIVASGVLLAVRAPLLRSERTFESSVSREGAFLLQNLLFASLAFAVFWGTVLPLVSQLYSGRTAVVGAAFYERVTGPCFLLLLALLARRAAAALAEGRDGLAANPQVAADTRGGRPRRAAGRRRARPRAARRRWSCGRRDHLGHGVRQGRSLRGAAARCLGGCRSSAGPPQPPPLRRLPGPPRDRRGGRRLRRVALLAAGAAGCPPARANPSRRRLPR